MICGPTSAQVRRRPVPVCDPSCLVTIGREGILRTGLSRRPQRTTSGSEPVARQMPYPVGGPSEMITADHATRRARKGSQDLAGRYSSKIIKAGALLADTKTLLAHWDADSAGPGEPRSHPPREPLRQGVPLAGRGHPGHLPPALPRRTSRSTTALVALVKHPLPRRRPGPHPLLPRRPVRPPAPRCRDRRPGADEGPGGRRDRRRRPPAAS